MPGDSAAGGASYLPHLKVATTADQFVPGLMLNVPAYCPLTETISASVAALEMLVSCNRSWNPAPAVTVPALLGTPSPANTSSLFDVVIGVGPVFAVALEPCVLAVLSSALTPVYSNTPSHGLVLVPENVAVTVLGPLAVLVA